MFASKNTNTSFLITDKNNKWFLKKIYLILDE